MYRLLIYYIVSFADNIALKNFLKMFFGNANFAGALCAFILDNTVPGRMFFVIILIWTVVS